MRDASQVFSLMLIGLGAAAISVLPSGGSVRELVELQTGMLGLANSASAARPASLMTQYAWAFRSGGVFAIVIGAGSLVIPWINALVYRRPAAAHHID